MTTINQKQQPKTLRLVNDVVFKIFFAQDEGLYLLRHFLATCLELPLEKLRDIRVLNPTVTKEDVSQRNVILDILVETDKGEKIHVEIQVAPHAHFEHRVIYQQARLATEQLAIGATSWQLQKQISIVIMDFELFKSPNSSSKFHRKFLWRDTDGEIFTDITEIHTLELPKVSSGGGEETDWLELFRAESEAELERLARKSNLMEQAVSRLRLVSGDEDVRKLISAKDYWTRMDNDRETYVREQNTIEHAINLLDVLDDETIAQKLSMDLAMVQKLRKEAGLSE